MQVIPYARPLQRPLPTRESGILFGCGIVLIVFGALTGVIGVFSSLAELRKGAGPTPAVWREAPILLLTIIASSAMICTGVGSVRLRRWSRAVVLCVCGNLLGFGAVTLLVVSVMHATAPPPVFMKLNQAGGSRLTTTRTPAIDDREIIILSAALMVLGLAVPLFFFLAYHSRRIAAALADADRRESWVDGRPLPAVALAMAMVGVGAAIFLAIFFIPPIPIGFASAETAEARVVLGGAMIVLSVGFAWSGWLIFRLHPFGRWLALLLIGLTGGGAIAAMTNDALLGSFGHAGTGFAPYELTWHLQIASVRGLFAVAAYAIPATLYVLHVRRIVREHAAPATAAAPERQP